MKNQRYDNRLNSGERGYSNDWQKVRKIKIKQDPLCEICARVDIDRVASIVHHIKPIETHPELRLVMSNLMSLCNDCHEATHGRKVSVACDVNGFPVSGGHVWNK